MTPAVSLTSQTLEPVQAFAAAGATIEIQGATGSNNAFTADYNPNGYTATASNVTDASDNPVNDAKVVIKQNGTEVQGGKMLNVGTYSIDVTSADGNTTYASGTLTIEAVALTVASPTSAVEVESLENANNASIAALITPTFTNGDGQPVSLTRGTDTNNYAVEVTAINKNSTPATATFNVTITGSNYTLSNATGLSVNLSEATVPGTETAVAISNVTLTQTQAQYTGSAINPTVLGFTATVDGQTVTVPASAATITWTANAESTSASLSNGKPLTAGSYDAAIDVNYEAADGTVYAGTATLENALTISACPINTQYVTFGGKQITSGATVSIPDTESQDIAGYIKGGQGVAVKASATSQTSLTADSDYEVSVNTAAKTFTVAGKGNYSGSVTYNYALSYAIDPEDISVVNEAELIYNTAAQAPEVVVKNPADATKNLVAGKDYTVAYTNSKGEAIAANQIVNAGDYNVVVEAVAGTAYTTPENGVSKQFTVAPYALTSKNTAVTGLTGLVYTGETIEQPTNLAVTATIGNKQVPLTITGDNADVTVTWPSVENATTDPESPYSMTVEAAGGNYTTASPIGFDFTVAGAPITADNISVVYDANDETVTSALLPEDGSGVEIADLIQVTMGETPLTGADFEVTVPGTANGVVTQPGNVQAVVTGKGNYTGTQTVTVAVRRNIKEATMSTISDDIQWTGQPIEPEFTVTYQGQTLTKGVDYTVSCTNNTNAGVDTALVTITGTGAIWGGSQTQKFSIHGEKATLSNVKIEPADYDGTEKTPKITFTLTDASGKIIKGVNPVIIPQGTDTYIDANSYSIKVAVEGKYEVVPVDATFIINPADLAQLDVAPVYPDGGDAFLVSAETPEVTPIFSAQLGGKTITLTDSDISGNDPISISGDVTLTGIGNFAGSTVTVPVKVAADINDLYVAPIEAVTYNGEEQTPEFTVYASDAQDAAEVPATEGEGEDITTNYTIEYKENINAGTAQIILIGKGKYGGTKTVDFTINKAAATLDFEAPVATYTGSAVKPEPVVTLKSDVATLTSGKDFTATYGYANNTDAGTATITVNASGAATNNYTFEAVTKDWTITAADIADATYTGETTVEVGKQPKVSLTFNGKTLVAGTDYDVTATPNVSKEGKANLTVTGKGNFQGTKTVEITVGKAPVNPDKPTSTAGWKQNSTGWWYDNGDNSYPTNTWQEINGAWYHFDKSGYMQTGWQSINGAWYYLNKKGQGTEGAMKTGWFNDNGTWYYLNKKGEGTEGKMAIGWKQVAGTWYYFNKSGAMQTGWQKVNGAWYYMAASGAMQTGWINLSGTWYYLNANGDMVANQWKQINGNWFYFYASGAMAANTWVGNYYVDANGYWVR